MRGDTAMHAYSPHSNVISWVYRGVGGPNRFLSDVTKYISSGFLIGQIGASWASSLVIVIQKLLDLFSDLLENRGVR